jgi:hypothetical protein
VTEVACLVVFDVPWRSLCGFGLREECVELCAERGGEAPSWQDEFVEGWIDLDMSLAVRMNELELQELRTCRSLCSACTMTIAAVIAVTLAYVIPY